MRWHPPLLFTLALAVLTGAVAYALDQPVMQRAVTITLVGDVMLGRGVATVTDADPHGIFADVRLTLRSSDLTLGNLESALTTRSHISLGPNDLTADPETASLLAGAGFDILSLANNHVGDAGPDGVLDTIAAVESAGMRTVGAGDDAISAAAPLLIDVGGLRVAVLAFDATGAGLSAGSQAGVSSWNPDSARVATQTAAADADLVIVSVHGGVEYLPESDPRMLDLAETLVASGADLVWGHGPHVVAPISLSRPDSGRTALVATSLGNVLFDQRGPDTGQGVILHVMADRRGVVAYRTASTSHHDMRVHLIGWDLPHLRCSADRKAALSR